MVFSNFSRLVRLWAVGLRFPLQSTVTPKFHKIFLSVSDTKAKFASKMGGMSKIVIGFIRCCYYLWPCSVFLKNRFVCCCCYRDTSGERREGVFGAEWRNSSEYGSRNGLQRLREHLYYYCVSVLLILGQCLVTTLDCAFLTAFFFYFLFFCVLIFTEW